MKKIAFFAVTLLCSHLAFATETSNLTGETIVSALVDPNAETSEFSATRGAIPSNAAEYEAVHLNSTTKIAPKNKREIDRSLYYSVDASYPQISSRNMTAAEQAFNKSVNTIIDEEMRQFKNSVQFDMPHMKTLPKEV